MTPLKAVLATVGTGSAVSFSLGAKHVGIALGVAGVTAVILRLAISAALDAKTRLWEERWTSVQSSLGDLKALRTEIQALRLEGVKSNGTLSGEIKGLRAEVDGHERRLQALEARQ